MTRRLNMLVAAVVLLAALVLFGYAVAWALLAVTIPYPLELREGAMVASTYLLLDGKNPYSFEFQPAFMNVYGMGYVWAVYPFALLFGPSFLVHRAVALALVVANAGLVIWGMRREAIGWLYCLPAGALLFWQLGMSPAVAARPDSLGITLLLASLVVPASLRYSRSSLGLSILFSILGWLTKPYFILGIPVLALYLFLFRSKKAGLVFGFAAAAGIALTVVLMHHLFPAYYPNTFFHHLNGERGSWAHLWLQVRQYSLAHFGFLAVALAAFVWSLIGRSKPDASPAQTLRDRLWALGKPVFQPMSLPAFAAVVFGVLLVVKLGRHTGTVMTYFHHLLTPFLLWVCFRAPAIAAGRKSAVLALALILVNIGFLAKARPPFPDQDVSAWAEIERAMARYSNLHNSGHVAELVLRHGKRLYDNGMTEYCWTVLDGSPPSLRESSLHAILVSLDEIRKKLRGKMFDAVFVPVGVGSLAEVAATYELRETLRAPMLFDGASGLDVQVWEPKKGP